MSPEPPKPNTPLLKSAEHIRGLELDEQRLQGELGAHRQLLTFIYEHLVVPWPKSCRMESMLFHQREIAQWIQAALKPEPMLGPADTLAFLQQYLPETPYQVEEES